MVFCVPGYDSTKPYYQATARSSHLPNYHHNPEYIEDGGVEEWYGDAPTAIGAAYQLYLKLANNARADWHPKHKPQQPTIPNVIPKDDCNYNTIYDDKHEGKLPCKTH